MRGGGPVAAVKLAELRFNEGLSPEQLGDACEISGRTIRRLEEGAIRPSPAIAKKLADHFDIKPTDIWPLNSSKAAA
jgi:DNA-binding XRE family transcriptional regulator